MQELFTQAGPTQKPMRRPYFRRPMADVELTPAAITGNLIRNLLQQARPVSH